MLVYLFDPPEPNPARPLSKSNLILKITIHTDTNPIWRKKKRLDKTRSKLTSNQEPNPCKNSSSSTSSLYETQERRARHESQERFHTKPFSKYKRFR